MPGDSTNQNNARTAKKFGSRQEFSLHPWLISGLSAQPDITLSPETLADLMLSSACSAQGRLAAALAHEINSPLGALQSAFESMSTILRRQEEHPEERLRLREVLSALERVAQDACRRLSQIVTQIQRFTHLDRSEVQMADVNQLLTDALALLPPESKQTLKFVLDLKPLRKIQCKPRQLSAAFQSLLSAITATAGTRVRVSLRSSETDEAITIRIDVRSDNWVTGAGVEMVAINLSPDSWSVSAARNVIRALDGELVMDDVADNGTLITMTLPCSPKPKNKDVNTMSHWSGGLQQGIQMPSSERAMNTQPPVKARERTIGASLPDLPKRGFVIGFEGLKELPAALAFESP